MSPRRSGWRALAASETVQALVVAVLILLLVVLTSDAAPRWIYQGF
jgi:hypothetical protein